MTCEQCRNECRDNGGICNPPSEEEKEGMRAAGLDWGNIMLEHRSTQHQMRMEGGRWVCEAGHAVEASGSDLMRHAGAAPLFEL